MAFSTWNPSDKSANITLSGSDLIATASGAGEVRGKDPKVSGKYYIEYTSTTTQGSSSGFGFGQIATQFIGSPPFAVKVAASNGAIQVFNSIGVATTGATIGAISTGTVLCLAIDLDARLIWGRIGAAGNWNGSASANPATGVGGIDISAAGLGAGIDCYPYIELFSSGNSLTANFGGSAFTGAVPSGFTSGWDDSVSPLSNTIVTQVAAEAWGSGTPAVQLTQAAIEEWGATSPPMVLTQIATEQWAVGTPALALTQIGVEQWVQNSAEGVEAIRGYAVLNQGAVAEGVRGYAVLNQGALTKSLRAYAVLQPLVQQRPFRQQQNLLAYEDEQLNQEWSLLQRTRNYRTTWTVGSGEGVSKFAQYAVLTTPTAAVSVSKFAQNVVLSTPNAALSVSKMVQYVVLQPPPGTAALISGASATGRVGTVTTTYSGQKTLTGVAGTSGVGTLNSAASAFTVWSLTDLTNTTIDATHLAATASSGSGGVRAVGARSSGKYYWECTLTTLTGTNTSVGIAAVRATLSLGATPTAAAVVYKSGAIWVNNVNSGSTLGALSAANVIGIAVDLDNQYIWFRVAPSGNWNGSATANPASTTGGISLTGAGLGLGFDAYPIASWGATSDKVTANFGASAFSGTVPATFTSGLSNSVGLTTSVVPTQIGAEVWYQPNNAQVQLTQIGAEVFYSATNIQYQLTQVGFEVWASNTPSYNVTQVGLEVWASVAFSPVIVGVSGTGLAGLPSSGSAGAVSAIGSAGIPGIQSSSNRSITGVAGISHAGIATPSISESVTLTGVSATGAMGTVTPDGGQPGAHITGVEGDTAVASLAFTYDSNVTPTNATGSGIANPPSTEIDIAISGSEGSGQAGDVTTLAGNQAATTGAAVTGSAGTVGIEIDAVPSVQVAWNGNDSLNITLSGNNLVATLTASGAVRGNIFVTTGKYYWEHTFTNTAGDVGTGVATGTASLSSLWAVTGAALCRSDGFFYVNGTFGGTLGAFSNGHILCIALDLVNQQIWFRKNNGNWNGSGTADPANNVGGLSLASIGGSGTAIYPAVASLFSAGVITANFGGSVFSFSAPSGFASGLPNAGGIAGFTTAARFNKEVDTSSITGVQASTSAGSASTIVTIPEIVASQVGFEIAYYVQPNVVVTQVAANVWANTDPSLVITQIGIEVALFPTLIASQVGFELAYTGSPHISLTQTGVEAAYSLTPCVVASQVGIEVAYTVEAPLRVTQAGAETWIIGTPAITATQIGLEIVYTAEKLLVVTQAGVEVAYVANPKLRATQLAANVWAGTTPAIHASALGLEVGYSVSPHLLTSQLGLELAIVGDPKLSSTKLGLEVAYDAISNLVATKTGLEVAYTVDDAVVNLDGMVLETLDTYDSTAKVANLAREVMDTRDSIALTSGTTRELVTTRTSRMQSAGVVREVMEQRTAALRVDLVTREVLYSPKLGPTALDLYTMVREVVEVLPPILLVQEVVREIVFSDQSGPSKAKLSGIVREAMEINEAAMETAGIALEVVETRDSTMNVAGMARELIDVAETTYMQVANMAEEVMTTRRSTLNVSGTVREVLVGTRMRIQPNIFVVT